MEGARLESSNYKQSNELESYIDVELVYDITNRINSLDIAKRTILKNKNNDIDSKYLHPYLHKYFDERKIRILFKNCSHCSFEGGPNCSNGEIKFGGKEQIDRNNRYQDRIPGHDIIIERPYVCFYNRDMIICFNEEECEISAELF